MRHTHAAANEHCEAYQSLVFKDSHEANVLRIDIDTIIARKGNAYLEFAWQVRVTIDRFHFRWSLNGLYPFSIYPNLMVCPTMWREMHGNLVCNLLYFCLCASSSRSRTGHHIAVHISTGRECREQAFIDTMERCMQVPLEDAVQLKPLSRGDTQCPIGITSC